MSTSGKKNGKRGSFIGDMFNLGTSPAPKKKVQKKKKSPSPRTKFNSKLTKAGPSRVDRRNGLKAETPLRIDERNGVDVNLDFELRNAGPTKAIALGNKALYGESPSISRRRKMNKVGESVIQASSRYQKTGSVSRGVSKANGPKPKIDPVEGGDSSLHKLNFLNTKRILEQDSGVESIKQIRNRIHEILESEGSAPYGRTKLMFVGEGRAGKTSSIKALLNKKFDPAEGSTKGFDVSRVDAQEWKEDNGSYLVEHLQRLINDENVNRTPSKASVAPPAQTVEEGNISGEEKEVETAQAVPPVTISEEETFKYGRELVFQKGKKNALSFSIWDFGGQKVFYTLHHLFLTEYGCYVLVVNSRKLLDSDKKHDTIAYMRFWLFSKKIHAPSAPIMIAGTRCTENTEEELKEINMIIKKEVLGFENFNEIGNGKMSFFPIDNVDSTGIDDLRNKIEIVVKAAPYTKELVPVSFLRALQLLLDQKKDFLTIQDAQKVLGECGLTGDLQDVALDFLNQRGLIVYFSEPHALRQFIVLQPQWLIEGLTDIFFDFGEHDPPVYDDEFNREFRKFEFDRIMSKSLLKNIWDNKDYSIEVQTFFLQILQKSSLICDYKFDSEDSFLIPSLFETTETQKRRNSVLDVKEEYDGPYFVLDFSGDYDEEMVKDSGDVYVRYLPIGVFERLVCLCIEHSGRITDSITPKVSANCCQMSFGVDVDFQLQVESNENGSPIRIRVSTESEADMEQVKELIKTLYTMLDGLKEDFFSNAASEIKLAISLLIPSSEDSGEVLADYHKVKTARERYKPEKKIRPTTKNKKKIQLKAYDSWFVDASGLETAGKEDLTNPNATYLSTMKEGAGMTRGPTLRPLQPGLKYHCFLSYKQQSAIDIVGKQYFILSNKGFKCWYDQQFEGSINLKSMQDGVRDSMCYILFLSEHIFPSAYVEAEVTMALQLNKPIILLHHPDTGSKGYWSFGDYINNAPEVVKPLFSKIESIQLQRRYYLEQAVTDEIERRLMDIGSNWHKKQTSE